jgi:hypothetical protein
MAKSLGDYVSQIASTAPTVVSGISELAGAEIKPAIKHAGVGGGLMGAALTVVYGGLKFVGVALALLFSYFYERFAGFTVIMALFLGFITAAVLWFVVAIIFALMGKGHFGKIHGPQKTGEEISATLSAIGQGISAGSADAKAGLPRELTPPPEPEGPYIHFVTDPVTKN